MEDRESAISGGRNPRIVKSVLSECNISYMDPDPLDPYYGRLARSRSVWRDTDPDPGHINVQKKDMAKEFCVNKFKNVDFFNEVLKY